MTFKHIKFDNSPVMRSLEKIAKEKGMVKESLLEKIASRSAMVKKADLTPTTNLMENLIKLCSGLREEGFDKYADELESTFMMFKQAQTLYETSKETGEDLVDMAHPKGSHKLEDVSGDAVFETIIDQQLKDIKMVEKKPTGKLSNANEIIRAVKMCLAEDVTISTEDLMKKRKEFAKEKITEVKSILDKINSEIINPYFSSDSLGYLERGLKRNFNHSMNDFEKSFSILNSGGYTIDIANDIISNLKTLSIDIWKKKAIFNFLGAGDDDVEKLKDECRNRVKQAIGLVERSKRIFYGKDSEIENKIKSVVQPAAEQSTKQQSTKQQAEEELATAKTKANQYIKNEQAKKMALDFLNATQKYINNGDYDIARKRILNFHVTYKDHLK